VTVLLEELIFECCMYSLINIVLIEDLGVSECAIVLRSEMSVIGQNIETLIMQIVPSVL